MKKPEKPVIAAVWAAFNKSFPKELQNPHDNSCCENEEIIEDPEDAYFFCKNCFKIKSRKFVDEMPFNSKNSSRICYQTPNVYLRINHLKDILNRLQGRENRQISYQILNKIKVITPSNCSVVELRQILKKLQLTSLYNNVNKILNLLGISQPIVIDKDLEANIYFLFNVINSTFENIKTNRTNSLNYNFILLKIFQLLNLHHITHYLVPLKNNKKLIEHTTIWQQIAEINGWELN